ncbi:MAG: exopolyphosphatase [Geobacteraceae bacterium]|nr:exopolyphosphatase [Geobacteraceae bacterium]
MNTDISAAIDLGTNSARLLIATGGSAGGMEILVLKRVITRLGGGFSRERGISPAARDRTLSALRDFAREMRKSGVSHTRAVATSAVRDAVNGMEFVERVYAETGIRLEIIDGREEALLTLKGVVSGLGISGDSLVFDIGGGSTEYTFARGKTPLFTRSLPLGVVRLTEGKGSIEAMDEKVRRELNTLMAEVEKSGFGSFPARATLIGTAGTATTLAAMDLKLAHFDRRQVHGHVLGLSKVRELFETVRSLTAEERLQIPGIEKGREDLVVAGFLITLRTMESFGFDRFTVSDAGLLEGLLTAC